MLFWCTNLFQILNNHQIIILIPSAHLVSRVFQKFNKQSFEFNELVIKELENDAISGSHDVCALESLSPGPGI